VIQRGDYLLAMIAQGGAISPGITWPNGWTEIFDDHALYSPNSATILISAAWKKADGSEERTVEIPTVAEEPVVSICLSIAQAADPEVTPPFYDLSGNNSLEINPPTLDTGVSDDYLWITLITRNHGTGGGTSVNSWDANYTARVRGYSDTAGAGDDAMLVSEWRQHTDSSENPGGFDATAGGVRVSYSATFAIPSGSFDPGDWWYQGRYKSGRGQMM